MPVEHFSSHPASAGRVRRFVRGALEADDVAVAPEIVDEIVLLACELATNALVHAGTDFDVRLELDRDHVRVGVHDRDPRTPPPFVVRRGAADPHGLQLVEAMSDRWGIEQDGDGKVVWFLRSRDSRRGGDPHRRTG